MPPLLEASHLVKKYGELAAVDDVSFSIEEGEIFGLLGPNGAGKSTTIAMLSGLFRPSAGAARIGGLDVVKDLGRVKQLIGVVPQDLALYPTLSGRENVTFFGELYGLHGKQLRQRVDEVLGYVGMVERAKDPVNAYSGGMKRRINLAAGLVNRPRLLFLDEPTVGVDPQSRNHIFESVERLNREQGMTVLYTTHYMEEAERLCVRVGIIDRGKLIALDTPRQLISRLGGGIIRVGVPLQDDSVCQGVAALPAVAAATWAAPGMLPADGDARADGSAATSAPLARPVLKVEAREGSDALVQVINYLNQRSVPIQSLEVLEPNLETVFLHLTGEELEGLTMNLLASFRKDLLLLLRDRGEMAALFLMPLAFILPICLTFPANGYNLNADVKPGLPVAVYDVVTGQPPAHTQELLDSLAETFSLEMNYDTAEGTRLSVDGTCPTTGPACDEAVARGRVQRDERNAGLVIPFGLSAAIDAGQHISLTLLYNPARSPVDRQLAAAAITGSTMQLSIQNQLGNGLRQFEDLIDLVPAEVQDQIRRQVKGDAGGSVEQPAATPAPTSAPALDVVSVHPTNSRLVRTPNTVDQTVPGYTVMFVFFLIGTVTASLQLERNTGMLRRLLTTPMRRSAFLSGKILAGAVIGVLQVAAMFAIGYFFFHMNLGSAPFALLLLTVAVVLSAVCIGLAAAAYRIERGINIFLIVAALLAGCAFPVDWLPPFLRTINVVLPQTWAVAGYQDLLTRGLGFVDVLPEIGVLLGFALVFFLLALRRFHSEITS